MKALVVGPMLLSEHEVETVLSSDWDYVVAVDGGVVRCAEQGVKPSILIGDFDSLPAGVKPGDYRCSIDEHPRDKDYSDLDAVVAHLSTAPLSAVSAVGLAGGRLDHQLVVLHALSKLRQAFGVGNSAVTLHGDREITRFLVDGDRAEVEPERTFSVIPLVGSGIISISGARWDLAQTTVDALSSHGLSNESGADGAWVQVAGSNPVLLIVQVNG